MGKWYTYHHSINEHCNNEDFELHSHDSYEILIFHHGDTKHVVEEKIYSLNPDDIIVLRKGEMHHVQHNSDTLFDRTVLNISPRFFIDKNCEEYQEVFLKDSRRYGNKIKGEDVRKSGLHDAIERLRKYSEDFTVYETPVIDAALVEVLYLLNTIDTFKEAEFENKRLKPVISFIKENFTNDITLDELSKRFFISKHHLCRSFKEATGHTVQSYVRYKRVMYARELIKMGESKTSAALKAGFNSYSSYYRAEAERD
ncbi:MAG: helix-turn-helix transcriptional regulator [Clostridia bacterium]|nr:helix-turn-helix transcriptional regulator [Clostridia bacterium]